MKRIAARLRNRKKDHSTTICIVGAGPAGVGIGVLLKKLGFHDFVIVDKEGVGGSFLRWPKEMKLLTPSFTGQGFSALDLNAVAPDTSPAYTMHKEHLTGEEYAGYLELLADHYELPIMGNHAITHVQKEEQFFLLEGKKNTKRIEAEVVIWAAGEFSFPKTDAFEGDGLALHTSQVNSWRKVPKGHHYVIGGFESAMDAAASLVEFGNTATVLMEGKLSSLNNPDPSLRLSPYTMERLERAYAANAMTVKQNCRIERITLEQDGLYHIFAENSQHWTSPGKPFAGTGFQSGAKQIASLFEWRGDGKPLLTETADESTLTDNLFLAGPNVQHDEAVFCFIYKFRQRFAVMVQEIFNRRGISIDEDIMTSYKTSNMFLDDLTCCDVNCEC